MNNQAQNYFIVHPFTKPPVISNYDDFGVKSTELSYRQRKANVEIVIKRFFVKKHMIDNHMGEALKRELIARSVNSGLDFDERLLEAEELADGGFGPELSAPSNKVEDAFRKYGQTELGAVVLARLIEWDNQYINMGWREIDGTLTEEGIRSYGQGKWRPFRVASNGMGSDAVTPSGMLVLPDDFHEEYYSTGDISHPFAILHHEIKAHVLPLKEAEGLVPGRKMELICVRLESEMLWELGLPGRQLNWGMDDGTLDHTLHEPDGKYYHGLVRYNGDGLLIEIDPESGCTIGLAIECIQ